ncbi:MAG: CIA30 family protein [Bacteroidetes bacterium]|jgi:hypothetical protein|nr:CIA30 family protein [Bacteroidota bacterium]
MSLFMVNEPMQLFDFARGSDLSGWNVVDDVVMGGRSDGRFKINEEGNGLFYGDVSLENYGGFSSIRYRIEQREVSDFKVCKIRLKGDGKRYQFRVKTDRYDRHSYIYYFETSGLWETIEIPLEDMYPTFRGRRLNMPNYPVVGLEEITFLIANKKAESFQLELDWIIME